MLRCSLNPKDVVALWDTGAQVSVISQVLLDKLLPDTIVRDVLELLDSNLELTTANGTPLPYTGWVELELQLPSSAAQLTVPFLVTRSALDVPLIGFNAMQRSSKLNHLHPHNLHL